MASYSERNFPCNCNRANLTTDEEGNSVCLYKGKCRNKWAVYCARCKQTNKFYIGNTQRPVKERMSGHFNNTVKYVKEGKLTDTFGAHFGDLLLANGRPPGDATGKTEHVQNLVETRVIWQGNPLKLMRGVGTEDCHLCMAEHIQILKFFKAKDPRIINSINEIYSACQHKSCFHWLAMCPGTEKADTAKREM